jgi:hypothetical protein
MIVIGSRALHCFFKNQPQPPKDWDLIMSFAEFSSWSERNDIHIVESYPISGHKYHVKIQTESGRVNYEIELENQESSKWLLDHEDMFSESVTDKLGESYTAISPMYQLLTKKSHVYFPIHIEKTLNSYHNLKSLVGHFAMNEDMQTYFNLRHGEAQARFTAKYKTRNLNVSNDTFFDNPKVKPLQVLEHDTLHEIVKHQNKPIYEMMKYDDKKDLAWCEADLFNELSMTHKIQSVLEESYVISLERFIIPQKETDLKKSFLHALHKVCTTLCSGWFREFAIENYTKIVESYEPNYFSKYEKYVNNIN